MSQLKTSSNSGEIGCFFLFSCWGKERCTFWWGLKMGNVYVMTSIKLAMNQIENCNFKFTAYVPLDSGQVLPLHDLAYEAFPIDIFGVYGMCAFCSMITTLLPNRRTRAPSHNIDAKYAQNAVHYYYIHTPPSTLPTYSTSLAASMQQLTL